MEKQALYITDKTYSKKREEKRMEIQGYNMPEDLFYEENHFWVKEEGDLLVMGMDDFAQTMAGRDCVYTAS